MAEYAHQLPGPFGWLNKGANWLGRQLEHVPGLGRQVEQGMAPGASLWEQLQPALLGGLMAGGAATGAAAAFPGLAEAGPGAGLAGLISDVGGSVGDVLGAGAKRAAGGIGDRIGGLGNLFGGTKAAAEVAGEGETVAKAARGLERLPGVGSKIQSMLEGGGALKGVGRFAAHHPFLSYFGTTQGLGLLKGMGAGASPDALSGFLGQLGVQMTPAEAAARQEAMKQAINPIEKGGLGLDPATARNYIYPEIEQHFAQQQMANQQLAMQSMIGLMNPYIKQVRDAGQQQAKILRGLLPSVPSRFRPLLEAQVAFGEPSTESALGLNTLAGLSGLGAEPQQASSGGGVGDISQMIGPLLQQLQQGG